MTEPRPLLVLLLVMLSAGVAVVVPAAAVGRVGGRPAAPAPAPVDTRRTRTRARACSCCALWCGRGGVGARDLCTHHNRERGCVRTALGSSHTSAVVVRGTWGRWGGEGDGEPRTPNVCPEVEAGSGVVVGGIGVVRALCLRELEWAQPAVLHV